jgi:hypothetical protein
LSDIGKGTFAEPFTHGSPDADRRRRWCRCVHCGVVERCTPRFDFYTPGGTPRGDERGPLRCEGCLWVGLPRGDDSAVTVN